MKYIKILVLLFASALLSVSCINEDYDINKDLDMELGIGGDSLAFPLGSTDTLSLSSLLGDSTDISNFLKTLEDGTYAFSTEDSTSVDLPSLKSDDFYLDKIEGNSSAELAFDTVENETKSAIFSLKGIISDSIPIDIEFNSLPSDLVRLDSLQLKATNLILKFKFQGLEAVLNENTSLFASLKIVVPEEMQFESMEGVEGNVLSLQREIEGGEISFTVKLRTLDLGDVPLSGQTLNIRDKIKIEGLLMYESTVIPDTDPRDENISLASSYVLEKIYPQTFYGIVDPELDDQVSRAVIDEVPSILQGPNIVMDFDRPHLEMKILGNAEVAMDAAIAITPYIDGAPLEEAVQNISLTVPASNDGKNKEHSFWIAASASELPAGYTYINANLPALMRRIPDSLRIVVSAKTNQSSQHRYNFDATYKEKVSYKFVIPMSFGPDLNLEMSDTISNMPSILNDILASGEAIILGSIQNTLPLGLTLKIVALDSVNNVLPLDITTQSVGAGTAQGGETVSPLNISIADRSSVLNSRSISSLVVAIGGRTEPQTVGVPVKNTSYVRATLKVKKPGGIIINLQD